jgi:hypothetical protein
MFEGTRERRVDDASARERKFPYILYRSGPEHSEFSAQIAQLECVTPLAQTSRRDAGLGLSAGQSGFSMTKGRQRATAATLRTRGLYPADLNLKSFSRRGVASLETNRGTQAIVRNSSSMANDQG